ncbi:HNH endonuclease [Brevibacillus agri]|uniref:HNH endonuclease n=1 Tax=Brevibacillus agri TaxID=51101 RepID=UPI001C8DF8FB|nr:HNH endonuclease [Brevibacillus agri]MBY0052294.1 HNH endonuclease [Brevibacillus agri]
MKNDYIVVGEVTKILLRRKGEIIETIISTRDLEKVLKYKYTWFASWSHHTQSYYVLGYTPQKRISLHRFLLDDPEGLEVDHINHDTLDNRRQNLRAVTQQVNAQNRKGATRRSRSGVRGVHWDAPKQKWQVRIPINGVRKCLGLFYTIEEAKSALEAYKIPDFPLTKATYK